MELWDLYTADRQPIGRTMRRGEPRPEGCYNLSVSVWIRNAEGKYLISQRAANKSTYPLWWETVGGGVLAGETTQQAAVREVLEEVGITVEPDKLRPVFSQTGVVWDGIYYREIMDVYLYDMPGEYDAANARSEEVAQSVWLTRDEIRQYLESGKMIETLEYFFDKIDIEGS